MKNTNSSRNGKLAIVSLLASSVFSYLEVNTGDAAFMALALISGIAAFWLIANIAAGSDSEYAEKSGVSDGLGKIAIAAVLASTIFSYLWGTTGANVYGVLALLSGVAFVWAVSKCISSIKAVQEAGNKEESNDSFDHYPLGRAA